MKCFLDDVSPQQRCKCRASEIAAVSHFHQSVMQPGTANSCRGSFEQERAPSFVWKPDMSIYIFIDLLRLRLWLYFLTISSNMFFCLYLLLKAFSSPFMLPRGKGFVGLQFFWLHGSTSMILANFRVGCSCLVSCKHVAPVSVNLFHVCLIWNRFKTWLWGSITIQAQFDFTIVCLLHYVTVSIQCDCIHYS